MVEEVIGLSIRTGRPIWFDSSAIIVYLQRSHVHAPLLRDLIESPAILCGISSITLAEALAGPARTGDELSVRRLRNSLQALPGFWIAPLDNDSAELTAWIRITAGLNLPDAGIIASARRARAVCIVGNDRRWRGKPIGIPFLLLDDLPRA